MNTEVWVSDSKGALVNLDFVTAIEPTVMESSRSRDGDLLWEITAHRAGAGNDWILLTHLDRAQAFGVVRRLGEAMASGTAAVEMTEMANSAGRAPD